MKYMLDRFKAWNWLFHPPISAIAFFYLSAYVFLQSLFGGWGTLTEVHMVSISLSALIFLEVFRCWRRYGTALHGNVLVLAAFAFVYPVSAVAHFYGVNEVARGFYDLARSGSDPDIVLIYDMFLLVIVAFASLCFGLNHEGEDARSLGPKLKVRSPVLIMGILFTVLGLVGSSQLIGGGSLFEEFLNVDSSREIAGGLARFVFMSQWLSWGLMFLAAYLIGNFLGNSRYRASLLILLFSVIILLNIFWTGGRASAIVSILPGFMILDRMGFRFPKGTILGVGLLALIYIGLATVLRTISDIPVGGKDLLLNVLDWHAGRFSMIGLGYEMVYKQGFAWGTTLPSGLINAINAPLEFVGISSVINSPQGMSSLIGEYMHGNPLFHGIVPGTICEFYYNFGIVGVAVGYYLIGCVTKYFIGVMKYSCTVGSFGVAAYIVVLVCITVIPGTATAWVYYLVTTGLPVIALYAVESMT